MKQTLLFRRFLASFFLIFSFFNTSHSFNTNSYFEFDAVIASVIDDVYRKSASDCTVDAIARDVQSILNSMNIIVPTTIQIRDLILLILQNNCCSVSDALILSAIDKLSISVLPCTVSGLDELERQISIGDALILSAIDNESCCAETSIATSTTLSIAGIYCLCQNVATIDIFNTDIVLNLNGHVVTNGITVHSHNITIKNGTVQNPTGDAIFASGGSNITISRVRAEGAGVRGINLSGVDGGLIEYCELVKNVTGIELNGSAGIEINNTIARSNKFSGFSLASSSTNSIRDCQSIDSGKNNTAILNNNVYGFVAQQSSNNIFENCIANATQALSTTDYNSIVAGFALEGISNCNKIIGCEAANAITNASGVTVPYGIYLQGMLGLTITLTAVPPIPVPNTTSVNAVQWSPDRRFIAVGAASGILLSVYAFDGVNEIVQQIALPDQTPGDVVNTVDWSPDGKYLAAGMNQGSSTDINRIRIYAFDDTNNSLIQVAVPNPTPENGLDVLSVRWSPNGKYLAVGTSSVTRLRVYEFDRVNNTLLLASSVSFGNGNSVNAVDWSSDGRYLAAGLASGSALQVYSFIPSPAALTPIASSSSSDSTFAVRWSPDCLFIARGGSTNTLDIWQFNPPSNSASASLQFKIGASLGGNGSGDSVDWSGDGRYVVVGYDLSPFISVLSYNRGSNQLTGQVNPNSAPSISGAVTCVDWSPDGQYIVGVTASVTDPNRIYIYKALTFPYDNVITDNTVYCNSGNRCPGGVGICGPSICNMIIQNTSYSNPINPAMASSNYQFVCNVFNQCFGQAPTLMQNIALGSCEPIAAQDDCALLQKQTLARVGQLTESGLDLGSAAFSPSVVNALNIDVIQLLKTILIRLGKGTPF